MKKMLDSFFSLRMLVTEHKHPVMSTRNRLHEFLVDDACALACSGMLRKSENPPYRAVENTGKEGTKCQTFIKEHWD